MSHYICTGGCGGVSENAGACQAQDCPKHGEPLDACECADPAHQTVIPRLTRNPAIVDSGSRPE